MRTTLLTLSVLAVLGGCDHPQHDAPYSLPIGVALRGAVDQVLPPTAFAELAGGSPVVPKWGSTTKRGQGGYVCFAVDGDTGCSSSAHVVMPAETVTYSCVVYAAPPGVSSKADLVYVSEFVGDLSAGVMFATDGQSTGAAPALKAVTFPAEPGSEHLMFCELDVPTLDGGRVAVSSTVGLRVAPVVSTYDPVLGLTGEPGYEWRPFVDVAMGHSQSYSVEGAQ